MSFLKNLFQKKEEPVANYADFWAWFAKHEKDFLNAVRKGSSIEEDFFEKLSPKLDELKDGFFYVTGMLNDDTAKLVFTADGAIANIVFVEELVNAAPTLAGWKFVALKPPIDIQNVGIAMDDYTFDKDSLSFYSNDDPDYPDEIDITIVHRDYKEEDKESITGGTYLFIDNFVGELNSVTTIDNLVVIGKADAKKELIPIEKLKDFLIWREKEFIEKYEGVLQNTDDAEFSVLQADLESGNMLIATINTSILSWENKASHPWLVCLEITFDGHETNGMPDPETDEILNQLEDKLLDDLKDHEGYLYIGHQTADGVREIYLACRDFRKPSKVLHQLTLDYPDLDIKYQIYKDKYWKSYDRFLP
ncbi:DUF695 domain-containing protein [Chryseolinea lacunae]|uniref:DUF695 domain-containing protein n=1 Tax=Chryseolinea lacunae TaxID=2801331 RepID=A0ABS1KWL6_9BACT|nr:DUF695 domain-containing protein [Chryseolinea lacunae]MBL0743835.1 DUF695 domain-containing protein [Chryseolinea lacunae]